jgi:flagellar hook assembly protein FlgD
VVQFIEVSSTLVQIKINEPAVTAFQIVHDWTDIEEIDNNFGNDIVAVAPNPITATTENTTVTFEVNKSGNVFIELFDVLGNKVSNIVDDYFTAGSHTVNFDLRDFKGSKLSSGSYTVRMITGMEVKTFNLIVLQ